MARHIMAVCVVCLLYADRLPCQDHRENIMPLEVGESKLEYQKLNAKVFQRTELPPNPSIKSTVTNHRNDNILNISSNKRKNGHHRHKRHAGHTHDTVNHHQYQPEISKHFLQRIFDEYGQGDGTININEFQRMLKQLGLHKLIEEKFSKTPFKNETCVSDVDLVYHIQPHDRSHSDHNVPELDNSSSKNCNSESKTSGNYIKCKSSNQSKEVEQSKHEEYHNNYTINAQDIYNLCPVLLYQLSSTVSNERSGCINASLLATIDNNEAFDSLTEKDNIMYVWIYAFLSVLACGILGLVGVAIIPFMDSRYYKHIIQFLVSLAVGTMTGDALLHLLPHSLAGQSESNMIFKGLTCMGGIIFFYLTEHGLTMISEWRKRIAKKETKKPSRAKVMRDPDSSIINAAGGDKLCKSKYSSYPYCYDEIAMDTKNDVWLHLPNNLSDIQEFGGGDNNACRKHNGTSEADNNETAAQSLLSTSQNNYAPISELKHHQKALNHSNKQLHLIDNNTISTDIGGNSVDGSNALACATTNGSGSCSKDKETTDTVTVILREHESSHHGHSHKHGHVHSPPESLSAVAWMIIMGDGLHNFTDGMAIGAAFADNIAGGFSTSLAVFCHELPHELGDFAILMKAGMSVKSAVYYNLLTGVLSFIGMIFGIVFGQSQDAAQWMFAAASGLFIYIALVDMLPELSSAHKSLEQLGLQVLGMCTGIVFMLLIAIYEGDLMNIFHKTSVSSLGEHRHVH